MEIKETLKNCLHEDLGKVASAIFMERATEIVDTSSLNRESFLASANRIGKMVRLFIDQDLSERVYEKLKKIIDGYSWP